MRGTILAMSGRMRTLIVLCGLALPACFGGIESDENVEPPSTLPRPDAPLPPSNSPGHPELLDFQMVAEAANVGSFAQVNAESYKSDLGDFKINVYINKNASDFRKVHPESSGSNKTFPQGTLIVRQVLDASGKVTKVTLMAKGPAGYDPRIGDWWFGVTDPAGVPLTDKNGVQLGRMTDCHGCHIPRAADDFLFGVPSDKQPSAKNNQLGNGDGSDGDPHHDND